MLVPVPAPLILLCTPIYAPDPGHEDREIQTEFHAIVHEDWKGVVTSSNTMARMLKVYTGARTFRATSWPELINMWHLDCTEYHNHVGEEAGPVPASKAPSPRAPGLLPSEDARARESKLCQAQMQDCANTARTSARGTRDLVSRVLAVKSSQLADRFDTLRIHSDASPPSVYQEPSSGTFNSYAHARTHQLPSQMGSAYGEVVELACGEGCERSWASNATDAPMLYAVSGHNRLFRSKDRAVAVLKGTPGAELAFSRDEDELLQFVVEYCRM